MILAYLFISFLLMLSFIFVTQAWYDLVSVLLDLSIKSTKIFYGPKFKINTDIYQKKYVFFTLRGFGIIGVLLCLHILIGFFK